MTLTSCLPGILWHIYSLIVQCAASQITYNRQWSTARNMCKRTRRIQNYESSDISLESNDISLEIWRATVVISLYKYRLAEKGRPRCRATNASLNMFSSFSSPVGEDKGRGGGEGQGRKRACERVNAQVYECQCPTSFPITRLRVRAHTLFLSFRPLPPPLALAFALSRALSLYLSVCLRLCVFHCPCLGKLLPPMSLCLCASASLSISLSVHSSRLSHTCSWEGSYGVASVGRIDKITGLFCKRSLLKRLYSAKETYNFIDPPTIAIPYLYMLGNRASLESFDLYTDKSSNTL